MKKKLKELLAIALSLVLLVTVLNVAASFLIPFRSSFGCTWEYYTQEPENSIDVLFFGSSVAYCDVVPAQIYGESGIRSYLMAGPEQTLSLTYYYVKETLKTQQPQAVVLELSGMFFREYETHTAENVSYMPWGQNRLAATFTAAEKERRAGLLFPFLDYHDLWYSTGPTVIKAHLKPGTDIHAGYTYLDEAQPQTQRQTDEVKTRTEGYEVALKYLRKIADYCREKEIKLLLYLAPSMRDIPATDMEALEKALRSIPHTDYMDYNAQTDKLCLDNETDWYDFLHLNFSGAVKFSGIMTEFLLKNGVTASDTEENELWKERVSALEALKAS